MFTAEFPFQLECKTIECYFWRFRRRERAYLVDDLGVGKSVLISTGISSRSLNSTSNL